MNEMPEPPRLAPPDPLPAPNPPKSGSRITVGLLLYLITLSAILVACIRLLVKNETTSTTSLLASAGIGLAVGLVTAVFIGFAHFRTWKGIAACLCSGPLVGILAGLLIQVQGEYFWQLVAIGFGGSFLLIVTMLLAARWQPAAP